MICLNRHFTCRLRKSSRNTHNAIMRNCHSAMTAITFSSVVNTLSVVLLMKNDLFDDPNKMQYGACACANPVVQLSVLCVVDSQVYNVFIIICFKYINNIHHYTFLRIPIQLHLEHTVYKVNAVTHNKLRSHRNMILFSKCCFIDSVLRFFMT